MRKVRSLVALVTIAAMLLSLGGLAGAAQFSDVPSDSKYAKAVSLLSDINVVKGYPDNTFRPANTLTREEFAAFVVRALGKENLAQSLANERTRFKDDAQIANWARGYVVYAASAGIIRGFPDNTFRPRNKVTYAEALAMLVRALGFEKYAQTKGSWPVNYLTVAEEIKLTKDLGTFQANLPIARGEMAIATYNAVVVDVRPNPDAQSNGEPQWNPDPANDPGAYSLLRRAHGWTKDQYRDRILRALISGQFKSYDAAAKKIELQNGAKYDVVASNILVINNDEQNPKDINDANVGLKVGEQIVLTYDEQQQKVIKVSVTRDTFANYLLVGVDVTNQQLQIDLDDTDAQAAKAVTVSSSAQVVLDGQVKTLSDLQQALQALRSAYGPGADAVVTVRTLGNNSADGNNDNVYDAPAIYVSVITQQTVTGAVKYTGQDAAGKFVVLGVGNQDRRIYLGKPLEGATWTAGDSVTLLLGHDGKAYQKLTAVPTVEVFWAHLVGLTTTPDGQKLVEGVFHVKGISTKTTRTIAGKQDGQGNYQTSLNDSSCAPAGQNDVNVSGIVAVRVENGRVAGVDDGHYWVDATSCSNYSGLGKTAVPSGATTVKATWNSSLNGWVFTYNNATYVIPGDAVVLKKPASGDAYEHSSKDFGQYAQNNEVVLADATNSSDVYYVESGGVRVVQIVAGTWVQTQ